MNFIAEERENGTIVIFRVQDGVRELTAIFRSKLEAIDFYHNMKEIVSTARKA